MLVLGRLLVFEGVETLKLRVASSQRICSFAQVVFVSPCDEIAPTPPDIFSFAIHDFMMEQRSFSGSATDLCELLYQKFNRKYFPNRLSRDLIQYTEELQRYGVLFSFRRSHGCRILELEYIESGDGNFIETTALPVSVL